MTVPYKKKIKKKSSIKRRMVFYFSLVAIANIFVATEFLYEMKSDKYRNEVKSEVLKIKDGQKPVEYAYKLFDDLAIKFLIMVGILILVAAVILFLFVTQIASPMQYMINRARKIAEGDLSLTIEIKTSDELSSLGNLINDLTANLQEIIAQIEQIHISTSESLEEMDKKLRFIPEIRAHFEEQIRRLNDAFSQLELLKESFTLFQVQQLTDKEKEKRSLGELLMDDYIITQEQLEKALEIQEEKGGFLGGILVTEGYLDQKTLSSYIKKHEENSQGV